MCTEVDESQPGVGVMSHSMYPLLSFAGMESLSKRASESRSSALSQEQGRSASS